MDAYISGLISLKNRDLRLSKIEDDIRVQRDRLTSLQAKRRAIAGMLEDREKDSIEAWIIKKADLVSVRRNIVELKTKKVNPYHFVVHYYLVFEG